MAPLVCEAPADVAVQWLYRGYVVAGAPTLIGRWRDTFTPPELNGYEVQSASDTGSLTEPSKCRVLFCCLNETRSVHNNKMTHTDDIGGMGCCNNTGFCTIL